MGKILYVEDELDRDKILHYFGKYLSDDEIEFLNSPEAEYREKIKEKLNNNPFLHVEFNFIDAIQVIEYGYEKFSFFIIDRDLLGSKELKDSGQFEYLPEEVPQILEEKVEPGCEGDWLFLLLLDKYFKHSNPRLLLNNFYFLTAYSPAERQLTIEESLNKLFNFFPSDHIILKDKSENIANFIEKNINQFEDLIIKSEHKKVFEVFQKGHLATNYEEDLLSVLKGINTTDSSEIKGSIGILRIIFQEIVKKIIETDRISKELPKSLSDKCKSGNLPIPEILDFLNGTPEYSNQFNCTTTEYFSNSHNLLSKFGFWKVCSEIAHGGKSGNRKIKYIPTKYTLPILINILMDFMIWFGGFMDKYKDKV
ncbi:MAG: hypothetical protein ABIK30_13780 [bacterium]